MELDIVPRTEKDLYYIKEKKKVIYLPTGRKYPTFNNLLVIVLSQQAHSIPAVPIIPYVNDTLHVL